MNTCRKLDVLNRKARGNAYSRTGFPGFRADWIFCAAILLAISVEDGMGVNIRPVLEAEHVEEWVFDGSGEWRLGGGELRLEVAGVPGGPIRRPAALALLKESDFERFELEAEVRSTADPGLEVADVLLIFAYRSPTQFYYVHLSGKTDAVALSS